jgi:dihydrofolate reductase
MSDVRVHNFAISLDGFATGAGQAPDAPFGHAGERLHEWMFATRFWHEMGGGRGGSAGADHAFAAMHGPGIGAEIMGAGKFGPPGWQDDPDYKGAWGANPPFHTPVFVLTHNAREPWVRPGATTFHFVTDGPQSALAQAKAAAGGKDVRIAGGADVVQQYLKLGAVEELEIALAPVLFGGGRRLFENLGDGLRSFQIDRVLHTPLATHLRYLPS